MFSVRVAVAPPAVGVLVVGENADVASAGSPETPSVTAGMVPVDPAMSVNVTVYVALFPLNVVRLGVTVMLKSYEFRPMLPVLDDKLDSPV